MSGLVDTHAEISLRLTYAYDLDLPSRFAAPIQILNTCRALSDLGVDVRVLTGSLQSRADECLAYYGLEPHPRFRLVPMTSHRNSGRRWLEAEAFGASVERHVVMSRGERGVAFFHDLTSRPSRADRLHVYEAHRPCSPERMPQTSRLRRATARLWLRRLERAAVTGADGLVCLTEGVREALGRVHPVACPTLILPSGTRIPAERPPDDDGRDLELLYAGKLESRKGVGVLLEAMRLLPGRRVTIVGGSPREVEEAAQLADRLGVAERVSLLGFMPPAQLASLWRRARVAVCPLPSDDEVARAFTSPMKLLEAMANGAPVVASDLPTVRALAEDGRTALLVEPDRPEALADAIRRLLEDRVLARRLAGAAVSAAGGYSWEVRARRLRDFLLELPATSCIR